MTHLAPYLAAAVGLSILALFLLAWRQWSQGRRDTPLAVSEILGLRLYGHAPEAPDLWLARAGVLADALAHEGDAAGLWTYGGFCRALEGTRIHLRPGPWYAPEVGATVHGLAFPEAVEVAYTPRPRGGALAHEWVHLWAERTGAGIDYDHAHGDGHWTAEVDRVIARVRGTG